MDDSASRSSCNVGRPACMRRASPLASPMSGLAALIVPAGLALCLALIAGCASTGERPDGALAAAETGIRQAQQAGANQHGAQPLASAQEKLAAARSAVSREEMQVATQLAEEAALDAELASAMARNRKAEMAVEEIEETIEVLRDEIARNQSARGDL